MHCCRRNLLLGILEENSKEMIQEGFIDPEVNQLTHKQHSVIRQLLFLAITGFEVKKSPKGTKALQADEKLDSLMH